MYDAMFRKWTNKTKEISTCISVHVYYLFVRKCSSVLYMYMYWCTLSYVKVFIYPYAISKFWIRGDLSGLVRSCPFLQIIRIISNAFKRIKSYFQSFFSQLRLRYLHPSSVGPPISSTCQNRIWNVLYKGVVLNQEYCGFSSVLLIYTITCLVVYIYFTVVY